MKIGFIKKRFYIKRRNRSKIEIDKLREKIRNENLISIPLDQSLDLALFIEKNNEVERRNRLKIEDCERKLFQTIEITNIEIEN